MLKKITKVETITVTIQFGDYLKQYIEVNINDPKSIIGLFSLIREKINPCYFNKDYSDIVSLLFYKDYYKHHNGNIIIHIARHNGKITFKSINDYYTLKNKVNLYKL